LTSSFLNDNLIFYVIPEGEEESYITHCFVENNSNSFGLLRGMLNQTISLYYTLNCSGCWIVIFLNSVFTLLVSQSSIAAIKTEINYHLFETIVLGFYSPT
jgi:hypothetical protein